MKRKKISIIVIGLLAILCLLGCEEAADATGDIFGSWIRVREIEVTEIRSEADIWNLELRNDNTFTEIHEYTNDYGNTDPIKTKMRQGTYVVNGDRIVFDGERLDLQVDVANLKELLTERILFTRDSGMIFDKENQTLYFGPDFDLGVSWSGGDSYTIAHNTAKNTYEKNFSLILTDSKGEVIESQLAKFEFKIIDQSNCSGTFKSENALTGRTQDYALRDCIYFVDQAQSFELPDGTSMTSVPIKFQYLDGEDKEQIDYYLKIGNHLLSYKTGLQAVSIKNAAFVRQ